MTPHIYYIVLMKVLISLLYTIITQLGEGNLLFVVQALEKIV